MVELSLPTQPVPCSVCHGATPGFSLGGLHGCQDQRLAGTFGPGHSNSHCLKEPDYLF